MILAGNDTNRPSSFPKLLQADFHKREDQTYPCRNDSFYVPASIAGSDTVCVIGILVGQCFSNIV